MKKNKINIDYYDKPSHNTSEGIKKMLLDNLKKQDLTLQDLNDCAFTYQDIAKILDLAVATIRAWGYTYVEADLEAVQKSGKIRYFTFNELFDFYLLKVLFFEKRLTKKEVKVFWQRLRHWLIDSQFYPMHYANRKYKSFEITIIVKKDSALLKIKTIFNRNYACVNNELAYTETYKDDFVVVDAPGAVLEDIAKQKVKTEIILSNTYFFLFISSLSNYLAKNIDFGFELTD